MKTFSSKKALTMENEKLYHLAIEKNVVSRFYYNDYLAYHYAFMMKVTIVHYGSK